MWDTIVYHVSGEDGSSVDTAPSVRYGGRPGDISWQAAYIALPYALYKTTGDMDAAKTYLDGMLKLINYVSNQCDGKAGKTCPTKYGDWYAMRCHIVLHVLHVACGVFWVVHVFHQMLHRAARCT